MSGKNWTGIKVSSKPFLLAAWLLGPAAAAAGQSGAAHFAPLQHSFGAPIAATASSIDLWRENKTGTLATWQHRQVPAVTSARLPRKAASGQTATAVFQSVAFRVAAVPAAQKWKAVLPHVTAANFESCRTAAECPGSAVLRKSIANAASAGFHEKLNSINRTVNWLVRYEPDAQNYRATDHWAAPSEILARGKGDCEDYAILKMAALKQVGLPPQSMSIVVVRDTKRNLYHAVLSVMTSQGYFILDNLSNEVKLDTALPDYQPLFSVSADRTWIHGIKADSDKLASAAPALLDVMPGEGALQ